MLFLPEVLGGTNSSKIGCLGLCSEPVAEINRGLALAPSGAMLEVLQSQIERQLCGLASGFAGTGKLVLH